MIIGVLYIIYFVVLIATFILCYFLSDCINNANKNDYNTILLDILIASIIAIIAIFISVVWVDTSNLSDAELIALNVLLIITFGLPILIIVILVFIKESQKNNESCIDECVNLSIHDC